MLVDWQSYDTARGDVVLNEAIVFVVVVISFACRRILTIFRVRQLFVVPNPFALHFHHSFHKLDAQVTRVIHQVRVRAFEVRIVDIGHLRKKTRLRTNYTFTS